MAPRDDDRPKRSWKEIDQAKTLGKKPRQDESRVALGNRYAYNKYKSDLNRLFDGGGMGALLNQGSAGAAKQSMLAEKKLLQLLGEKDFVPKMTAHISAHGLPKDVEVLMACFDLPDETLVLRALQAVKEALMEGRVKRQQTLRSRLKTLALSCDAPIIVEHVQAMLKLLSERT